MINIYFICYQIYNYYNFYYIYTKIKEKWQTKLEF